MDLQQYTGLSRKNNKTLNSTSHISYDIQKQISLDAFSESNLYMDSGYHSTNVSSCLSSNNENIINNSLEFDQSTKSHQVNSSKSENVNKKILNENNSLNSAKKSENSSYFNYIGKESSKEKILKEKSRCRFSEIKFSPINYFKQKKVFSKTRSESINSSTPIRELEKSSYFESAEKTKSLSKFEKSKFKNHKSFSPGKHAYFKKLTIDKSLVSVFNYNDEIDKNSGSPNPAKRLLLFDENQFEKLLTETDRSTANYSVPELKKPIKKLQKNKILVRQDAVNDRNIPENFILQNDEQNNKLSEPFIRDYFDEMKTLDTKCSEKRPANKLRLADSLEFLKDVYFERETIKPIEKRKLPDTEIYDTPKKICLENQKIKLDAIPTSTITEPKPTNKKLKRSLSVDYDPEREKFKILHPYLPCTPPKKKQKKLLKRIISSGNKTPVKRSLYEIKHKIILRASYEGIEKLNILLHLQNTLPALDIILNCMTGSDLFNISLVSKKWKSIVESNSKNNLKRLKYINSTNLIKENFMAGKLLNGLKYHKSMPLKDFNNISKNSVERKRSMNEDSSPPVSPSKRKFHENQKVCLLFSFFYKKIVYNYSHPAVYIQTQNCFLNILDRFFNYFGLYSNLVDFM